MNEQDVGKIITALDECLGNLPQQHLQRVCRIGVSGQMHGIMFWKAGRGKQHFSGIYFPVFISSFILSPVQVATNLKAQTFKNSAAADDD